MGDDGRREARAAEITIALSLATDLGTGQPMEHGLRTAALSLAAAAALGLDRPTTSATYHVALLRFLGCTSDAADTAVLAGGDDLAFNETMAPIVNAPSGEALRHFVGHLAEDLPVRRRVGRVVRALADPGATERSLSAHCEAAARLAGRLDLGEGVVHALAHAYERWDGKGFPDGLAGGDVPTPIRVVSVARDVELLARQAGWPAAARMLTRRRDRAYDPAVVDAFLADGPTWLAGIAAAGEAGDDLCARILDAEPTPVVRLTEGHLDGALTAMADFADLKVPSLRGHSRGVAELVGAAARAAGLDREQRTRLERAGLVHDIGRVGVPNGLWDRAGPLGTSGWERVRLHPYLSERVLQRCALLAPLAGLAGSHHERVDGSGYHRGCAGEQFSPEGRLLAAADAYRAMTEDRPHRPALGGADAAAVLTEHADRGRLGRTEVAAVLAAAGEDPRPVRVDRPAGLTEREVDVLRLIARGQSNKQAAARLGISPKTVGHHVESIYAKASVRTRAGATLFAMEHGLLAG